MHLFHVIYNTALASTLGVKLHSTRTQHGSLQTCAAIHLGRPAVLKVSPSTTGFGERERGGGEIYAGKYRPMQCHLIIMEFLMRFHLGQSEMHAPCAPGSVFFQTRKLVHHMHGLN